jgi:hypothetical protein
VFLVSRFSFSIDCSYIIYLILFYILYLLHFIIQFFAVVIPLEKTREFQKSTFLGTIFSMQSVYELVGCPPQDISRTSKQPFFKRLAGDVLHLITSYFTKDYHGLLKLRCLNNEWKINAESSLIWLNCSLTFYCQKQFLEPMQNELLWRNYSLSHLLFQLKQNSSSFEMKYENIIQNVGLFVPVTTLFRGPTSSSLPCKVICDCTCQRDILSDDQSRFAALLPEQRSGLNGEKKTSQQQHLPQQEQYYSLFQRSLASSSNASRHVALPSSSPTSALITYQRLPSDMVINRFEIATQISTWFLTIYRKYHLCWKAHIEHRNKIYHLDSFFRKHFKLTILPNSLFIALIIFAISLYGFSTLENNVYQGRYSWENHVSFGCIYLLCFLYSLLTLLDAFNQCLWLYRNDTILISKLFRLERFASNDLIAYAFGCCLCFMIMLHFKSYKMAEYNGKQQNDDKVVDESFTWIVSTIPIWVCCIGSLLIGGYELLFLKNLPEPTKMIIPVILIIVFLTTCSLTLISFFYDHHLFDSIGYAIIPLFPIIFGLLALGITMIGYIVYYWFYQGLLWQVTLQKRIFLMICGSGYLLSTVFMMFAMSILVVEGYEDYFFMWTRFSPVGLFSVTAFSIDFMLTVHLCLTLPMNRLIHENPGM